MGKKLDLTKLKVQSFVTETNEAITAGNGSGTLGCNCPTDFMCDTDDPFICTRMCGPYS